MKTFLQMVGAGIALAVFFVFWLIIASWVWVMFDELARALVLWTDELVRQLTGGVL